MNAYRLLLEGPCLHEEITIEAATIAEAAHVADEYRKLLDALRIDLAPAGEAGAELNDPATPLLSR